MTYKMIRKEDYKDEPIQYIGFYVLSDAIEKLKYLNIEPEVYFVEVK